MPDAPRFTFRAHERLRRPDDFTRARRQGRRRAGRCLVVWLYRRAERPPRAVRLGVVVSRRNGGAALRNRFKRRLRDVFRLNKHGLARGWDVVAAPRTDLPADTFPPPYEDLRADFLDLTRPLRASDAGKET
ncbi:MAG: ribonuclease P protein component [Elusimicrobiota bacterium]